MINANDYDSIEELDAAMKREHCSQITEIMTNRLQLIDADINQLNSLIQHPFPNEVANLQATNIYWKVDRIEQLAIRIARNALTMKSACRFIILEDDA